MICNLVIGGAYNLVYSILIKIGKSINKVVPIAKTDPVYLKS